MKLPSHSNICLDLLDQDWSYMKILLFLIKIVHIIEKYLGYNSMISSPCELLVNVFVTIPFSNHQESLPYSSVLSNST